MRILAYMPVFNEADVLPHVLTHMREQGVAVHVIDGHSDDGSFEIAKAAEGVTAESFPEKPSGVWACRPLLRRVEELAVRSGADWIYLSDCDEFRRSSRPGETLAEGIARVDAAGFNVIDHQVFAFFCTDSGWTPDISPEQYFRYYNTTDMICRLPQEKAWKNLGRVNLVDRGGHVVKFAGRRVYPEKFAMRHFPFRTPAQAARKLATRLERRCHEEHDQGWGVHYDVFKPGFSFCWNPADLLEWPEAQLTWPRPEHPSFRESENRRTEETETRVAR